jgi:K+-sensing histidine kinase KdpD
MAKAPADIQDDSLSVPWNDIVRFVRQLGHDIRNNLNAAELQSAYIAELTDDAELKNEIKRLREMVGEIGTSLQRLTIGLGQIIPNFMSYRAADFVEDVKQKVAKDLSNDAAKVNWKMQLGEAQLNIDPQLLEQAFIELFTNAFQHERNTPGLVAKAYIDKDRFAFVLHEPKARFDLSTENWGREPLRTVGQGHYGLGLNRVRVIVEAHGGELHAQYDPAASALVTTVTLPLSHEKDSK